MYRVKLKYRNRKNGIVKSAFLEFSPAIKDSKGKPVRYEQLNLELYIHPKNKIEKQQNAAVEEIAETIRSERFIQLARRNYSFIGMDNLDGDFLKYFQENGDRHSPKYLSSRLHFSKFCKGRCKFRQLTPSYCEKFKLYLLNTKGLNRSKPISHNSACGYYDAFLSIVKLAAQDNIIEDFTGGLKRISWNREIKKDILTMEEINTLINTPYFPLPELRTAALTSLFTGLRLGDILTLDWKNIIRNEKGEFFIDKIQHKTKLRVQIPINDRVLGWLGKPRKAGLIWPGLNNYEFTKHIPIWIEMAGIKKHITFYCFRHTFIRRLVDVGTDAKTITELSGHKTVNMSMVYMRSDKDKKIQAIQRLNQINE